MVIRCTQQKICALIEKTHVESRIGFQFSICNFDSVSQIRSSLKTLTVGVKLLPPPWFQEGLLHVLCTKFFSVMEILLGR
eukprot:UN02208